MFMRGLRPTNWCRGLLSWAAVVLMASSSLAQEGKGPEIKVDPIPLPLDRSGVWTFHFAYLPPRILNLKAPAQGDKQVWYMVYRVWNTSDTPQTFVPIIELVTKDSPQMTFLDEPQPTLLKQIQTVEDPTGALNLLSSVSMSKNRIPVTKVDSVPRAVYGVAIWQGVPEKTPNTTKFSVYVRGLSNGLALADTPTGPQISLKTLQLDFFRPTDNVRPRQDDIQPNTNNGLGEYKWIYRVIPAVKPSVGADSPPAEKKEP
jgi:hypothetical protein